MAVRTTFPNIGEDVAAFQKLTVEANNAWQAAVAPEPTPTAAAEFERLTGVGDLAEVIHRPDDPEGWIKAMVGIGQEKAGFMPTIGASYLPANLAKLADRAGSAVASGGELEATWLRPGGSTWGRTLRVPEAVQQLRLAIRNACGSEMRTTLAMPRSTHRAVRAQHRRIFERGLLLPQGHLPANLEILLIPGTAALVNVHIRLGRSPVALGGIVTDAKRLVRIAERLNPSAAAGWDEAWRPAATHARA